MSKLSKVHSSVGGDSVVLIVSFFNDDEIKLLKTAMASQSSVFTPVGLTFLLQGLDLLTKFIQLTGPLKCTKVKVLVNENHLQDGAKFLQNVAYVLRTKRFHRRGKRLYINSEGLAEAGGALLLPMSVLYQEPNTPFGTKRSKGKKRGNADSPRGKNGLNESTEGGSSSTPHHHSGSTSSPSPVRNSASHAPSSDRVQCSAGTKAQ
jgi:hypothetical protein